MSTTVPNPRTPRPLYTKEQFEQVFWNLAHFYFGASGGISNADSQDDHQARAWQQLSYELNRLEPTAWQMTPEPHPLDELVIEAQKLGFYDPPDDPPKAA